MTGTNLKEVSSFFLRLGFVAFGGPYAHAGMMEEEAARRKQWVSPERFAEGMAVCNALPGPMSTQLAIWLGYERAGWLGGLVAGVCFILPACLILLILSAVYFRIGRVPSVESLSYGVNPAVIAVMLATAWRMAKSGVKDLFSAAILAVSIALLLLNVPLVAALVGAGLLGLLRYGYLASRPTTATVLIPFILSLSSERLLELAWLFLKAGAFLYGGGFVIIAFVEQDVVRTHGWLTQREFLDGVALGQLTPGPILIAATFIGYKVAGLAGALVATVAIFLPSFLFIFAAAPNLARWRSAPRFQAFLKGVNPAVVAALVAAAWMLAAGPYMRGGAVRDWQTGLILVAALAVMVRTKVAIPWVIGGAALLGIALRSNV